MKKVAVIGAGNIGSRHLQALKAVNMELEIFVIDPNQKSLDRAGEIYNSTEGGKFKQKIRFQHDLNNIGDQIDIAIIATHSNIRKSIIEDLLASLSIKYFILEKILFTSKKDYFIVQEMLEKNDCKAWINCTRRMVPFYFNQLRTWFSDNKAVFTISGSKWKLVSNLIHFTDFLSFIFNDTNFSMDCSNLEPEIVESNIPNFYELNGMVKIRFKNGCSGIINCFSSGNQHVVIDLASSEVRCIIDENVGKSIVKYGEQLEWKEFNSNIPYTSQLTTSLVEDLLNNGTCELTPYNESLNIHLLTYEPLMEYLEKKLDRKFKQFPFT